MESRRKPSKEISDAREHTGDEADIPVAWPPWMSFFYCDTVIHGMLIGLYEIVFEAVLCASTWSVLCSGTADDVCLGPYFLQLTTVKSLKSDTSPRLDSHHKVMFIWAPMERFLHWCGARWLGIK